jgi:hypothetical protein
MPINLAGNTTLEKLYKGARFYINLYTSPVASDFTGKVCKAYFDNPTTGSRIVIPEGTGTDLTVTGVYHSADQSNLTVVMSQTDTANLVSNTDYELIVIVGPDVLTSYVLPVVQAAGGVI